MDRGDSEGLEFFSYVFCSHHSGVGRGFVSIGSDFHSSVDLDKGFSSGEIGNMDESVVPGGQNVGDGEDGLVLGGFGPKKDNLFSGLLFSLFSFSFCGGFFLWCCCWGWSRLFQHNFFDSIIYKNN